jgi:hypothetical protein
LRCSKTNLRGQARNEAAKWYLLELRSPSSSSSSSSFAGIQSCANQRLDGEREGVAGAKCRRRDDLRVSGTVGLTSHALTALDHISLSFRSIIIN